MQDVSLHFEALVTSPQGGQNNMQLGGEDVAAKHCKRIVSLLFNPTHITPSTYTENIIFCGLVFSNAQ